MGENAPHIIPSIYLANYLNDFEDIIIKYGMKKKAFKKGEYLTQYGVINNNTSRKRITILNPQKLLAHCTQGMRDNI